jgi:uncharacterized protein (TIGR04255 family)
MQQEGKVPIRLPEYQSPPVVETALAIEFASLPGWNLAHFGSLWEQFRAQYPVVEVHPAAIALNSVVQLDPANPPVRCFFLNTDGTQLVQVRSGAFVRNWRARPGRSEYPDTAPFVLHLSKI